MIRPTTALLAVLTLGAFGVGSHAAPPVTALATKNAVKDRKETLRTLEWDDLLPQGEDERLQQIYEEFYTRLEQQRFGGAQIPLSEAGPIAEGSALDVMPQLGTFATVSELDGQRVEIPGFAVPLDMGAGTVSSFLIVPYFGACIHTPPPPPNQIVYVTAEPAAKIEEIYLPYWFEGTMQTATANTDLASAAYTLRLRSFRPYE